MRSHYHINHDFGKAKSINGDFYYLIIDYYFEPIDND